MKLRIKIKGKIRPDFYNVSLWFTKARQFPCGTYYRAHGYGAYEWEGVALVTYQKTLNGPYTKKLTHDVAIWCGFFMLRFRIMHL